MGQGKVKPKSAEALLQDVSPSRMKATGPRCCSTARPCARRARRRSSCRTAPLAEAIAEEWRGQGERIDPATMPLTRLANSVIDGVDGNEEAVIDDILNYAGSDLLCYRARGPQGLVERSSQALGSVLAWAKHALGAPMRLAEGVMHVEPAASLVRSLQEPLQDFDPWSLAALHVMTGLTGSALLALAVASGQLTPEEAWAAAHVDEDWQIGQWGEDEEAAARRQTSPAPTLVPAGRPMLRPVRAGDGTVRSPLPAEEMGGALPFAPSRPCYAPSRTSHGEPR